KKNEIAVEAEWTNPLETQVQALRETSGTSLAPPPVRGTPREVPPPAMVPPAAAPTAPAVAVETVPTSLLPSWLEDPATVATKIAAPAPAAASAVREAPEARPPAREPGTVVAAPDAVSRPPQAPTPSTPADWTRSRSAASAPAPRPDEDARIAPLAVTPASGAVAAGRRFGPPPQVRDPGAPAAAPGAPPRPGRPPARPRSLPRFHAPRI